MGKLSVCLHKNSFNEPNCFTPQGITPPQTAGSSSERNCTFVKRSFVFMQKTKAPAAGPLNTRHSTFILKHSRPKFSRSILEHSLLTQSSCVFYSNLITVFLTGSQLSHCESQCKSYLDLSEDWRAVTSFTVDGDEVLHGSVTDVLQGVSAQTAGGAAALGVKLLVSCVWRSSAHVAGWEMGNEPSGQRAKSRVGFKDTAVSVLYQVWSHFHCGSYKYRYSCCCSFSL